MTREEAIDVLKHNYPSACFTDLCEAVDIAIKALYEDVPEKNVGKWIPVTERLPEIKNNNAERVIVTTRWGGVYEAYYCVDHWEIFDIIYKMPSVIAWLPLPEPYKGGIDEVN